MSNDPAIFQMTQKFIVSPHVGVLKILFDSGVIRRLPDLIYLNAL